jgi:hypothetical protein
MYACRMAGPDSLTIRPRLVRILLSSNLLVHPLNTWLRVDTLLAHVRISIQKNVRRTASEAHT